MKSMWVLWSLAFSVSVLAADLRIVAQPQSPSLANLKSDYSAVLDEHHLGDSGLTVAAKIVSSRPNETLMNTIKQLVYKTHTGYSSPEGGIQLTAIENANREAIIKSVDAAFTNLKYEANETRLEDLRNIRDEVEGLVFRSRSITLFEGFHANSFGDAHFIALYDFSSQEVLLIESYYAE